MNYFALFGIRRSGNHFITNWIISNIIGEDYYKKSQMRNVYAEWGHQHGLGRVMPDRPYPEGADILRRPQSSTAIDLSKPLDSFGINLFFGLEDTPISFNPGPLWNTPGDTPGIALPPTFQSFPRGPRQDLPNHRPAYDARMAQLTKKFILFRDPLNIVASSLASGQMFTNTERIVRLFLDYIKFLDDPAYIKIIYESVKDSKEYRDNLATQIGFENKDLALDTVPNFGGGSSFTRTAVKGTELQTGQRWEFYKDDPVFKWILGFPGLLEAREKIYGPLPQGLVV